MKLCNNCFGEIKNEPCPNCGYIKTQYRQEAGVLPVGTTLKQKYIIGSVLGRGGFGITYKAFDSIQNRIVAIKEYYPNSFAHRDTGTTQLSVADNTQTEAFNLGAEKFFDEAKMVSRFNGNPNIVSVYDYFYENNTVYYVMEYLDGCDLKSFINKNGGKLSQGQVISVLNTITEALLITHSLNVLHRDISPDNIFVQKNGEIKLIDFGAARQVLSEQSKSLSVILKQGFAPLEQYQRKGKQGPWTDIYALGATCIYALTGTVPDDATERIEDSSIGEAKDYGIDETLWELLKKCFEVRTLDRFQSIIELKESLKNVSIVSEPLVLVQKKEIPLTVAVLPDKTKMEKISETIAVSEEPVLLKKQLSFLDFIKSVKGVIVIATIAIIAVVSVAVIIIFSRERGNTENYANNHGTIKESTEQLSETEENYVTNITCLVFIDIMANSNQDWFTNLDWWEGVYTGEWKDGKPNGEGYFFWIEEDHYYDGYDTCYLVVGEWKNGALSGDGKRVIVTCSDTKLFPTIETFDWTEYAQIKDEEGYEWVRIVTGKWSNGSPLINMNVYGIGADEEGYQYSANDDENIISWDGYLELTK